MRALVVLIATGLLLVGCGGAATPTVVAYSSRDVLHAWEDHGLTATLAPTGGPTPSPMLETWLVEPPLSRAGIMLLYVAPSHESALAFAKTLGGGPATPLKWVQANVVLAYGQGAQPYLDALGDLR